MNALLKINADNASAPKKKQNFNFTQTKNSA